MFSFSVLKIVLYVSKICRIGWKDLQENPMAQALYVYLRLKKAAQDTRHVRVLIERVSAHLARQSK